jgi:hypothetical protein
VVGVATMTKTEGALPKGKSKRQDKVVVVKAGSCDLHVKEGLRQLVTIETSNFCSFSHINIPTSCRGHNN